MKHATSFTAVTNPTVNSYKRLVPGYEAPCYVAWSAQNRSPLIRIPASRGISTRVEVRSVDPAANPYLALSVLLAAGLDGIKNKLEAPAPIDRNIYVMSKEERMENGIVDLPATLAEALEEFKSTKSWSKRWASTYSNTSSKQKKSNGICSAHKFILGSANSICLSINISIPWHYWCQGIF